MKWRKRPARPRTPRRRWLWRALGTTALILTVTLVLLRLALPSYIQSYVNRVLDSGSEYSGRIGDIEVHLWRGSYAINDLNIVKTTHTVPVPFFESPRVEFSLDWPALMHGSARGHVLMNEPRLNFVHGRSPDETQTGVDQPWLGMLNDLFPFRIDKAEIRRGEVHFRTFYTDPPIDVYLSEVQGDIRNLTNIEDKSDPLIATVTAYGKAMDSGRFEFDMRLDPQSYRPDFELATRLVGLDVTRLNPLTRAYANFDFEEGQFDFVLEVTTRQGYLDGYAKPLFRHTKVLSVRDIEKGGPLQFAWEGVVGVVGWIFKNQDRDQFGTRLTLQGELDNPNMNILEVVGNVLYNAFVQAYLPRVEGGVAPETLGDLERQRIERRSR